MKKLKFIVVMIMISVSTMSCEKEKTPIDYSGLYSGFIYGGTTYTFKMEIVNHNIMEFRVLSLYGLGRDLEKNIAIDNDGKFVIDSERYNTIYTGIITDDTKVINGTWVSDERDGEFEGGRE